MTIGELLVSNSKSVQFVAGEISVEEAIQLLSEKRRKALIIVEGENPIGIFTSGDVMRCCVQHKGRPISEIKLREAMTNKLIVAAPGDQVGETLSMMLRAGIGHLPVVDEHHVVGLLTLNALVEQQLKSLTTELEHFENYLADLQEAGKD